MQDSSSRHVSYLLKATLCFSSVFVDSLNAVFTELRCTVLQRITIAEIKKEFLLIHRQSLLFLTENKTFKLRSYLLRLVLVD